MPLTIAQAGLTADPNITHYWTCDSNFNDSIGSANGTDTNSPTYTAGKFSNAFTCASASSQYTTVANNIFPFASNTVWIHLWFKLAALGNTTSFTMTSRTGQGCLIYYTSGMLTFSKPNVSDLNYTWAAEDTGYHMLDCYADGSGMVIYLDNVNVASNANSTIFVAPLTDTITWGAFKSAGALQAGWYLNGQMDDIAIFTRIPTGTELNNLFNGTVSTNTGGTLALMGVG